MPTKTRPKQNGIAKGYGSLPRKGRPFSLLPDFPDLNASQKRFIAAYSLCGNLTHAAELARLTRQSHYKWLWNDINGYAKAFQAAEETAVERLEEEARRRAMQGSDTLLIFLLKAARPQVYRDNIKLESETKITHDHTARLTDEQRMQELYDLAQRIRQRRIGSAQPDGEGEVCYPDGQAEAAGHPLLPARVHPPADVGSDGAAAEAEGPAGRQRSEGAAEGAGPDAGAYGDPSLFD